MASATVIAKVFPKALPNSALVSKITEKLSRAGFAKSNTTVATSLFSDELARPLEKSFGLDSYGDLFIMGGLAGSPHAHNPNCAHCLVGYGPHVGVDSMATVGTVERRGCACGRPGCGSATAACGHSFSIQPATVGTVERRGCACGQPGCGSATAACGHVLSIHRGANPLEGGDIVDMQQANVGKRLMPYIDRLTTATCNEEDLQAALSY